MDSYDCCCTLDDSVEDRGEGGVRAIDRVLLCMWAVFRLRK